MKVARRGRAAGGRANHFQRYNGALRFEFDALGGENPLQN